MVRQNVNHSYVMNRSDELSQLVEVVLVIGDAGYDHVTYPQGDILSVKITGKSKDIFVWHTGELLVLGAVDMLDIKHNQIGILHQLVDLLIPLAVGHARGVKSGVYTLLFCKLEKLCKEVYLQKRLAAGHGYTAVGVEGLVLTKEPDKLLGRVGGSSFGLPGVGVVTVPTAKGTALKKYHKTNSGTVNGPKALYGMNFSVHQI